MKKKDYLNMLQPNLLDLIDKYTYSGHGVIFFQQGNDPIFDS